MSNTDAIGFPTLGELLQFVYDAFGVLPRKHSLKGDELDETQKKSIQRALDRLRKEDGNFNENIGGLITTLSNLVAGHIHNPRIALVAGEVISDIERVYLAVIQDEGTFWGKRKTIRWFVNEFLIQRLAFSLKKHFLSFNVASTQLATPGSYWFLPNLAGERIIMPLETVMRWIYDGCQMSQRGFHSVTEHSRDLDFEADRRLENAQNWIVGKKLPSLSGLMWNFNITFDHLESQGKLDSRMRESYSTALIIARVSTFVAEAVLNAFEIGYLRQICEQFREDDGYAAEEFADFKEGTSHYLDEEGISGYEADEFWMRQTKLFCDAYAENGLELAAFLRAKPVEEHAEFFLDAECRRQLVERYGPFAINSAVRMLQRAEAQSVVPAEFGELLLVGLELRKNPAMSVESLSSFERQVKASEVEHLLDWLVPWLHAIRYNWQGKYDLAFPYIQDAFNRAKYCAGGNQRGIIKLLLTVAAKCKKRVAFKRGVMWAQYMHIDFPWLRQGNLSDEDIDYLFEDMQES